MNQVMSHFLIDQRIYSAIKMKLCLFIEKVDSNNTARFLMSKTNFIT